MNLPKTLIDSIPERLHSEAQAWWDTLSQENRAELDNLCDVRKELFLFETFSEDSTHPKIKGGQFIPHDDAFGVNDWGEDYFDHLQAHPELLVVYDPTSRAFHIGCSRHPIAKNCFREGKIGEDFVCPFDSKECLMESIKGIRTSVRLQRVFD